MFDVTLRTCDRPLETAEGASVSRATGDGGGIAPQSCPWLEAPAGSKVIPQGARPRRPLPCKSGLVVQAAARRQAVPMGGFILPASGYWTTTPTLESHTL